MTTALSLDSYRLLGRSGLRVSPLSLGTMTFGETWGAPEDESRRIFDAYVDRGGNFIDTAGYYAQGRSEELTGKFAAAKRDRLVLSTKYSLAVGPGDPNRAGNGRKSMIGAVEDSLKRLQTDHIDLLFLHVWDNSTPADEILRAFDDLVRHGKILYIGISDTPAWQVARLQTMAELRGWTQLAALQVEYSLLERTTERDLIPMAQALGLGVMPWSPLKNGLLSGKYATGAVNPADPDGGRRAMMEAIGYVNERTVGIADAVKRVADAIGATSAQVALAWTLANPAVTAPLVGARTLRQLEDNIGALAVELDAEHLATLHAASRIDGGFPHDFLQMDFIKAGLTGSTSVRAR
ncbi:aldo/keto reductase [Novosphingobium lentum]|uniref:aldo/keto reductase n=1 Tax=Novosphingobium lentum TaxID=145287 RepID=UPI00082BBCAB|nr:aldo/keto reductase [Novosphingobium lentum]